ncbi:MAG: fatty acid kinase FakB2 [Candidatus Hepatoplasma vulgare]|nr:MAG: fatty acid kinase FakB2 [Candidatus Hepatoplasma sp.]
MKKIGILLDSSCGLSRKQAKSMGFYFVPILIDFDNKEYRSGIDINTNFLIKNMKPETRVSTAAITLGTLKISFDEALEEVEELIFISLSKYLSSINSTAKQLAKNYDGRVHVYNSNFITPWLQSEIPFLREAIKKQLTVKEIFSELDKHKNGMLAFLSPSSLTFLYKGGRITKKQYIAGNLLKIKPIIVVKDGQINSEDVIKTRTSGKAYNKMINLILEKKKELEENNFIVDLVSLTMDKKANIELFKNKLEENNIKKIADSFLAPEIIAHVGPNAMGIGIIIKEKNKSTK